MQESIKLFYDEKTIEQAEKHNTQVRSRLEKKAEKINKVTDKITELKKQLKELEEQKYQLEKGDYKLNPKEVTYKLNPREISLDLSMVQKVAKLDHATIYKISNKWFKIVGYGEDFDNLDWKLKEVTKDELYHKFDF